MVSQKCLYFNRLSTITNANQILVLKDGSEQERVTTCQKSLYRKFLTRRVSPPARRVQHIGGRMPEHSASCGSKMEPKSYQKWSPKP